MEQMPAPSTADLVLRAAFDQAKRSGFRFGEGADDYLRQHAKLLEEKLDSSPKEVRIAKIEEARGNFVKLVDEMILASQRLPGYADQNPGVIGERTLSEALSRLCPLWPFCD